MQNKQLGKIIATKVEILVVTFLLSDTRWDWNGKRVKQKDKRKIRKNSTNLKRKELSRICVNRSYHLSNHPKSIHCPSLVSTHFANNVHL